jgi:hypothetical protein
MRTLAKLTFAFLSISLVTVTMAADKPFQPEPPDQYPHQENEKVLIGGKPFDSLEQTKAVFGKKVNLNKGGILPVLIVIQNKRGQTLDLNGLEVKLSMNGSGSIIPLEPQEATALAFPAQQPRPSRSPIPLPHKGKENSELLPVVERAFTARMVPPGEQASGFFYFQTRPEPGMRLLINGIFERPSGKEILYFEIPL